MTETPVLKPIDEPKEKQLSLNLAAKEAYYLMNQITDICNIFQSAANMPETTKINRTPDFYIEEILRALKELNIIVD